MGVAIRSLLGACALFFVFGVSVPAAAADVRVDPAESLAFEAADALPEEPAEDTDSPHESSQSPVYLPGPEYMVKNLRVVSFGEGTADISWDRPSFEDPRIINHPHLITLNGRYIETCQMDFFDMCWAKTRTPYTLEDLLPGVEYTVAVTAGFSRGLEGEMTFAYGDPVELTFAMPEYAVPTEPPAVEGPSETSVPSTTSSDAPELSPGLRTQSVSDAQPELAATGWSGSLWMWVGLGCAVLGGLTSWGRRIAGISKG